MNCKHKKIDLRGLDFLHSSEIISFHLFTDVDTEIYQQVKCGIAMMSTDKSPYSREETGGNEFIRCSNDVCLIWKHFNSFKIPISLICPKSLYKHHLTRAYRSGKQNWRRQESPLWCHQRRSFLFSSHADDIKREIRVYTLRLLTNQKRESALSMG